MPARYETAVSFLLCKLAQRVEGQLLPPLSFTCDPFSRARSVNAPTPLVRGWRRQEGEGLAGPRPGRDRDRWLVGLSALRRNDPLGGWWWRDAVRKKDSAPRK
ncbi:hypothetical protein NDU88_000908 [Pleurodeles waltl]|uniref:Kisspeptin n=1 Tax=Pleurodeles waltl TaxID=8319 RepID=A0AAV7N9B6_PLEWA|nr:hypothetical protein NDU88_000908 [Pleurodeles waltl]